MEPIDMVWQFPLVGQTVRPTGGRPREDADLLIADTPEDEEPMVIKGDTMVPYFTRFAFALISRAAA
eukprot:10504723-Lingulodinium_polyedra.AAC.1